MVCIDFSTNPCIFLILISSIYLKKFLTYASSTLRRVAISKPVRFQDPLRASETLTNAFANARGGNKLLSNKLGFYYFCLLFISIIQRFSNHGSARLRGMVAKTCKLPHAKEKKLRTQIFKSGNLFF